MGLFLGVSTYTSEVHVVCLFNVWRLISMEKIFLKAVINIWFEEKLGKSIMVLFS